MGYSPQKVSAGGVISEGIISYFQLSLSRARHYSRCRYWRLLFGQWPVGSQCSINLFNCTLESLILTYYWYNSRCEHVWDRLSLVKRWPNWNRIKSLGLSEAISETLSRLRNDLYCVGWGVKLYSLTHSETLTRNCQAFLDFVHLDWTGRLFLLRMKTNLFHLTDLQLRPTTLVTYLVINYCVKSNNIQF